MYQNANDGYLQESVDYGWWLVFTLCFSVFLVVCNEHLLRVRLEINAIKNEKNKSNIKKFTSYKKDQYEGNLI